MNEKDELQKVYDVLTRIINQVRDNIRVLNKHRDEIERLKELNEKCP
jgi:cell shape-determining protein MreC